MSDQNAGKPFLLAILDGLALNPNPRANAVYHAKKPVLDRLFAERPWTTLTTFGLRVGLPEGQMGNSEVGHLNLGAGRIVQQDLTRITFAVQDRQFPSISALRETCAALREKPAAALHLIGLMSDGGVHASLEHLVEIVRTALDSGVRFVFLHAITDGRDRPPQASVDELSHLLSEIRPLVERAPQGAVCAIVSICGRYFAMDRDKRWERTELAYRLLTEGTADETFRDPLELIERRHLRGETDEFLKPAALQPDLLTRPASIESGDAVIFTNFRADRMRQIVAAFLQQSEVGFDRRKRPMLSHLCTLTEYEKGLPVEVLFPPQRVAHHLGATVADAGLTQLRIAETEKYAHVTYFFNGGVEEACAQEERILVPSPRDVATYDLKPEMSAAEVTDRLIEALRRPLPPQVVILNFANCDMVGHTGNFDAAVRAVETVDGCLGRILDVLQSIGGSAIVTADHGNADQMVDYETGKPHTYHTTYPVPCILLAPGHPSFHLRDGGALCDVAPTICDLIGLPIPPEMTGHSLLDRG